MARGRKITTFTEPMVAMPLNDGEVSAKSNELADVCGQIDTLKADAAAHASTERKKVRALELRRRVLAECVRTRSEQRPAQAELDMDTKKRSNGRGRELTSP